jgi:hypothetical protein
MSVDRAMVPLMGGTWAEVKTLALGKVVSQPEPHTIALSYSLRLADSGEFGRLAVVEIQSRGLASAQAVAAVTDGAECPKVGCVAAIRPQLSALAKAPLRLAGSLLT